MANEIKLTMSITYENGSLKRQYSPGTANIPQATKGVIDQTITATTAEADITITLGSPGLSILQNLEATTTGKTFNWGIKSSTGGLPKYFKLPPKQMAVVSHGTSADVLRGKAASGTLQVSITTFEG